MIYKIICYKIDTDNKKNDSLSGKNGGIIFKNQPKKSSTYLVIHFPYCQQGDNINNRLFKIIKYKKIIILASIFLFLILFSKNIFSLYWIIRFINNPTSDVVHKELLKNPESSFKKLAFFIDKSELTMNPKYWGEVRGNAAVLLAKINGKKALPHLEEALGYEKEEIIKKYYIKAFSETGEQSILSLIKNHSSMSATKRRNSLLILSSFEKEAIIRAVLNSLKTDNIKEMRRETTEPLDEEKAVKILTKALSDAIPGKKRENTEKIYYALVLLKNDSARKVMYKYYDNWISKYSGRVHCFSVFVFCDKHGSENMKQDMIHWLEEHHMSMKDVNRFENRKPFKDLAPGKDYIP